MRACEFTVYGKAQPAGSKRAFVVGGHARVVDANAKSRPWKDAVTAAAAEAMGGETLLDGPLWLNVVFHEPRPKGHIGAKGLVRPSAPLYPAKRPDATKLLRAVEDAMTGVVYRDDAQIVSQVVRKVYGEPARVEIRVGLMSNNTKPEGTSVEGVEGEPVQAAG